MTTKKEAIDMQAKSTFYKGLVESQMSKEQPEINQANPIEILAEVNFKDNPFGIFYFHTLKALLSYPNGFVDLSVFQEAKIILCDKF